jgi:hypothetical protein
MRLWWYRPNAVVEMRMSSGMKSVVGRALVIRIDSPWLGRPGFAQARQDLA